MKGMKFVAGFAVFGFVLSFISSLFSPHSSFIHKLLMALLFAVCFGGIGFGIKIVYEKFLSDSDGDFSSDFTPSSPAGAAQNAGQKGQYVDITIQDEEISPGESENRFAVGENHQMLNDSDFSSSASKMDSIVKNEEKTAIQVPNVTQMSSPAEKIEMEASPSEKTPVSKSEPVSSRPTDTKPVKEENTGFIPMNAAALTKPVSGPADGAEPSGKAEKLDDSEDIDELPDMSNFSFGGEASSSEDEDDDYSDDSDFGSSYGSGREAAVPEVKDAGLIAKAISSVLADENSM